MKNILILIILLTSGVTLSINAQHVYASATPIASKTQVHQTARIAMGAAKGELTRTEIRALNSEQKHIRKIKRRAKADGVITREERVKIIRGQRRANRHIRSQKNNRQKRHSSRLFLLIQV